MDGRSAPKRGGERADGGFRGGGHRGGRDRGGIRPLVVVAAERGMGESEAGAKMIIFPGLTPEETIDLSALRDAVLTIGREI